MKKLLCILLMSAGMTAAAQTTTGERPVVNMVANAHFDTQWRWDVQQSIEEFLPNTLLQNFKLFETYPDYIFNFEGADKYAFAKEYYPDQYEKLKKYVAEGRWNICGSSWDANDPNMPSIEASIRNFLYGEAFYQEEFGKQSHDVMLPDCFGFGWQLPTVAAHCGLTSFHTQKLQWRANAFYEDGRKYPFKFGIWEGIDGSRIMVCLDGGDYFWNPSTENLNDFSDFRDRFAVYPVPAIMRYFGTRSSRYHGDQGGSPTSHAVYMIEEAMKTPGDYDIRFATTEQIFNDYYMDSRLPVYSGELLMDVHATGCYTSHSEIKKLNRRNEWMLVSAEGAGLLAERTGAMEYPSYTIDEGWKTLVMHQFHDDLTGTSYPRSYQFTYNDQYILENQLKTTVEAEVLSASKVLDTRVSGIPVVVYNPLSFKQSDVVEVELEIPQKYAGVNVYGPSGSRLNAQIVSRSGNRAKVAFATESDPVSISVYDVRPMRSASESSVLKATGSSLENSIYRIEINADGDVCSIVDKRCGKELVKPGCAFGYSVFGHNVSNNWPAWEILKEVIDRKPANIKDDVKVSVEEIGALRAVVRIEKRYGESTFVQKIVLTDGADDDRIDFVNEVDWHSAESLLKYSFPMNLNAEEASYDLGLGNVRRGNNKATQYEVFAHQWADMTADDGSYGITILNDSKYGWDKPDDNTLRLTLHHTPTADGYDVWQKTLDFGPHTYTFSVVGHEGQLDPVAADMESDCINQIQLPYVAAVHKGAAGKSLSAFAVSDSNIRVKAFKKALDSDGIIVRTYELTGSGTEGDIIFPSEILGAEEVDGVEHYKGAAQFSGNTLHVKAGPFEPKSFRVRLAEQTVKSPSPVYEIVELPYNEMAITSDAFSSLGHADEDWHSFAAEIIPENFRFAGIPFEFGKADFKNALRCRGQKISLPQGSSKVYLLAACSDGERDVKFKAGSTVERHVCEYDGWYGSYGWEGYYDSCLRSGNVAYKGTHRHDSRKRNEAYVCTYMYLVEIPVSAGASELELPDSDQVYIYAATALK